MFNNAKRAWCVITKHRWQHFDSNYRRCQRCDAKQIRTFIVAKMVYEPLLEPQIVTRITWCDYD